jgi:acyl-CoA thioesterase
MNLASAQYCPIVTSFVLEQTGPLSYRGQSVADERRPVVFGGQIMGQMIVAAAMHEPDKRVKSLHTVFARAGTVTLPVDLALDPFLSGRAFGSIAASATQGDRMLSRGLLLLDRGEPDVIRHQVPKMTVGDPDDWDRAEGSGELGVDLRVVDGVDLMSSAVTGPPELYVWVRWQEVPGEFEVHQALLSWFTDPFLIGAAMRPHEGIGQDQAHETLSTGVITHTLTFHEDFRSDDWLLIANHSQHAGGGRTYGDGHVFTQEGKLVASFVQTNMIRQFRADAGARGKATGAM